MIAWNFPKLAARGAGIGGAVAIAAGLYLPWYRVPAAIENAGDAGGVIVSMLKPASESVFKGLILSILFLAAYSLRGGRWWNPRRRSQITITAAIAVAGVSLYFPQQVVVADTELSHAASWLEEQHDSMVWFGGDIYTAREFTSLGQGMPVDAKDLPANLGAVPIPNLEWDLLKLYEFIAWSGFTPSFWEFVRGGWALTLLGCIGIIIGSVGVRGASYEERRGRGLTRTALAAMGVIGMAFIVPTAVRVVGTTRSLNSAQSALREGNHVEARASLDRACWLFPCLNFDTSVLLQKGRIDRSMGSGEKPAEAALFETFELQRLGYTQQATERYRSLADNDNLWVARAAQRSLLGLAIDCFNAAKYNTADGLIEEFLAKNPCSVKALYIRLLRDHQSDDLAAATARVEQITAVYRAFQTPEKRGVLATAHGLLAELRFDSGDADGALASLRNRIVLP